MCQGLFLIKLQVSGLELYYKRDSGTGVFLWILLIFEKKICQKNIFDKSFNKWNYKLMQKENRQSKI